MVDTGISQGSLLFPGTLESLLKSHAHTVCGKEANIIENFVFGVWGNQSKTVHWSQVTAFWKILKKLAFIKPAGYIYDLFS